ncbi:MAG: prepilin-type N-terminal cleavage/methylation domain-containing protein [Phycisphaerae bacterium]|nr:prepilin-type N-terminal cleavage/methylation domain-containing protein [Phycisphaerae bacterium]
MSARTPRSGARSQGFTLIELLVVVAIIALLISILLPSLSKARAQARTTLCASRMSQYAKAFFMYADDFGEMFPFICYGRGVDDSDPLMGPAHAKIIDRENWLAGPNELDIVWDQPEENWPSNWANNGWLFTYTRFETLYRCPEFERVNSSLCHQNKYNFSRCITGRKGRVDFDEKDNGNCRTPYAIGFDGPIVKPSTVYASSRLPLVVDEDWFGYVAYPGDMGFSWDKTDPIMDIVDSYIGPYHGAPIEGVVYDKNEWDWRGRKPGSVAAYDGHVELVRDAFPAEDGRSGGRPIPVFYHPVLQTKILEAYLEMLDTLFYAQQGKPTSLVAY